jgi:6-phosphogluconolactonase (cycloisomerase 2 family)
MKFMKFGKAFLISALSAVVVLGLTSCAQSYSVGYLYVTGTVTSDSTGNGIVSGFKIDHNTGKLTNINGMPVSSGGANPSRAVLLEDGRFLYVLNRGTNSSGGLICTTADPCQSSNITQFAVGANGSLTAQQTFYTQGLNPFRIIADSTGSYIYVLDHDSIGTDGKTPSTTSNPNPACTAALGKDSSSNAITTCGDITAFSVNATTGRLSLIQNTQVQVSSTNLTYFPVPSNSVDFVLPSTSTYVLTLSGTSTTTDSSTGAYTGGTRVFPYNYVSTSGQLTATGTAYPWDTLTDSSTSGVPAATAIVSGGSYIYVLDDNPIYLDGSSTASSQSQILPYTISTNGALAAATSGAIADDASGSDPIYLIVENKSTWFYVANQSGTGTSSGTAESNIAGYVINSPYAPSEMSGSPFSTGSGPQCIVEDPSNQFIYTANFNSSTVTGLAIDQNAGTLSPLSQATKASSSYTLTGPPTWCLVTGRTN